MSEPRVAPGGVDVDGHERLGVVDHDRATRRKAHAVVEGSLDSTLDLVPAEQWHPILVELEPADAVRHDQAHELARLFVHLRRIDQYLVEYPCRKLSRRARMTMLLSW